MHHVKLIDLSFDHMFSYGPNNKIVLNQESITQLVAPNGRGKTSLLYIIQELLFGKNVKGIKKGAIIHRYSGAKSWSGTLRFEVNGDLYETTTVRTGEKVKLTLTGPGGDLTEHKVADTYKKIQDLLGIDFEIFSQLTYKSSRDSLEFLEATDTNRKKFLINLFNLEQYLTYGESIKVALNQSEKTLLGLEGEERGIIEFLNGTSIPASKTEIVVPEVDSKLERELEDVIGQKKQHLSFCNQIENNNQYITERSKLKFDVSLLPPDIDLLQGFQKSQQEYQKSIVEFQTQIKTLKSQLSKLDLRDSCYACGQPINNSLSLSMKEKLDEEISEKQKNLDLFIQLQQQINSEIEKLQKDLANFNQNQKAIQRFEQLSQLIDKTLPREFPNLTELDERKKAIEQQLISQRAAREQAIKFNSDVAVNNGRIELLVNQKRQFLVRHELLKNDILNIRQRISRLTVLKKAYSTTGIVAFKLENLTKELEETINSYLTELSDGQLHVSFRLDGEKLNIIINDQGKEAPIENNSGGEFSRIQIAILLAIRKILTHLGGTSINFLFLDEISGVLDADGKEKLIEVLRDENLNVLLVAHDFTHPLVPQTYITKQDKISRIE